MFILPGIASTKVKFKLNLVELAASQAIARIRIKKISSVVIRKSQRVGHLNLTLVQSGWPSMPEIKVVSRPLDKEFFCAINFCRIFFFFSKLLAKEMWLKLKHFLGSRFRGCFWG